MVRRLQVASAFYQSPWWHAFLVMALLCACVPPIGRAQSAVWNGKLTSSQQFTGSQPFDPNWPEATTSTTPDLGATISGETTSDLYFPEAMQAEPSEFAYSQASLVAFVYVIRPPSRS
ncbi:MAG: hypothetical protein ACK43N_04080, partial [Pirellulaceae bacterium]